MEKFDWKSVGTLVGLVIFAGFIFYTVSSLYPKSVATQQTLLAQDTTLNISFKSTRGYERVLSADSTEAIYLDKVPCADVDMNLLVVDGEVLIVFKGKTIDVIEKFQMLGTDPMDERRLFVVDKNGHQLALVLLHVVPKDNPNFDPNAPSAEDEHEHWLAVEDWPSLSIYSTVPKECKFLKQDN